MERRSLNQKGGFSSQQTRQEGIISKEARASSPTKRSQDFIRLEREGLHKNSMSSSLDGENSSQSIVACQEQWVHEVGPVDHSQEFHDQRLKEKLEKSIAKHFNNFENFIRNFKKIKEEANRVGLEKEFSTYKQNIEQSNYLLCCSLKEGKLTEADKCIKECEARKREFETYLKEQIFEKDFKTKIVDEGNGRFFVASTARSGSDFFQNRIDVGNGQIIGINNKKYYTKNLHFSDVIYNQLQLILKKAGKDISQFDLRSWYGKNVVNDSTGNTAEILLGENRRKTFKAGSSEFNAIMKTATAKSKVYLLEQHPEAFQGKQVTGITEIRNDDGGIDINYEFGNTK